MITIKEKKNCCGCTACATICPHHAISMKPDKYGFFYPVVNSKNCTNCGLCEKVCPILHNNNKRTPICAYAIKNNDEKIRKSSSSGGLFPVFAKKTIESGGIVYGASFDKQWNVRHIGITQTCDINLLQGSKYVQSNTFGIYKDVKQELLTGRNVLFTGTPCQVAGLKHYLIKEYDNLTTIDFVCHGVPNPMIWKDYLSETTIHHKLPIANIEFRNKTAGWKDYHFIIKYTDSTAEDCLNRDIICHHNDNIYMKLFLDNYILRPSCYSCKFRDGRGGGDYTIGDYWGIQNIDTEFDDDKGTSLLLKYKIPNDIPLYIKQCCTMIGTPVESALKGNPALTRDWPTNRYSKLFYFLHINLALKISSSFTICSKVNNIVRRITNVL